MKEKTETKASFNSETTKAKDKEKEVKKEVASTSAPVEVKEEKAISEMTDDEIEEFMKKRRAEKDNFTIKNEDVPMCKLIRTSVVPAPKLNQQEVLRSVIYRQNKLERDLSKKG